MLPANVRIPLAARILERNIRLAFSPHSADCGPPWPLIFEAETGRPIKSSRAKPTNGPSAKATEDFHLLTADSHFGTKRAQFRFATATICAPRTRKFVGRRPLRKSYGCWSVDPIVATVRQQPRRSSGDALRHQTFMLIRLHCFLCAAMDQLANRLECPEGLRRKRSSWRRILSYSKTAFRM